MTNNNNNKEYYGKPCLSNECYTIFNSSVSKLYHVKREIMFQIIRGFQLAQLVKSLMVVKSLMWVA